MLLWQGCGAASGGAASPGCTSAGRRQDRLGDRCSTRWRCCSAAAALLRWCWGRSPGPATGRRRGAYARVGLAGRRGALVWRAAGSLWQAGFVALSWRPWPAGMARTSLTREDRPAGTWLARAGRGLGLTVAALAWIVGAGDLDFGSSGAARSGRARSELLLGRVGGPFGGLAPAVVAAGRLGSRRSAWALAWPRLAARAWGDGAVAAAAAAVAAGRPSVVVLLRTYMPLALAPTALAALTLWRQVRWRLRGRAGRPRGPTASARSRGERTGRAGDRGGDDGARRVRRGGRALDAGVRAGDRGAGAGAGERGAARGAGGRSGSRRSGCVGAIGARDRGLATDMSAWSSGDQRGRARRSRWSRGSGASAGWSRCLVGQDRSASMAEGAPRPGRCCSGSR